MSASALARGPQAPLAVYLDLLLLAVAFPLALALGAPALGSAVGAGAWLAQRLLALADRTLIRRAHEPRTQLGLTLAESFGRIWLLAGAIVAAGLIGGRADGLSAGLVICGSYSIAFAVKVITGPRKGRSGR